MSAKTLKDMGLERVSHIESGFGGWQEAGLPVVDYDTWKATRGSPPLMTPEEFHTACQRDGWQSPQDKEYVAGDVPTMHDHDFDATVLITKGELRMVYRDGVDVLGPGDRCVVAAGTMHSEQPGPGGASGLLAMRLG